MEYIDIPKLNTFLKNELDNSSFRHYALLRNRLGALKGDYKNVAARISSWLLHNNQPNLSKAVLNWADVVYDKLHCSEKDLEYVRWT